jgi:hypothetical protein
MEYGWYPKAQRRPQLHRFTLTNVLIERLPGPFFFWREGWLFAAFGLDEIEKMPDSEGGLG